MHPPLPLSVCNMCLSTVYFFSLHFQSDSTYSTVLVMFHALSSVFCSFFFLFLWTSFHSLFTCILCYFCLLSFNSTYSLFPVWTKAPPALFLKGILPVSDCMCLMHFGSPSPQHLTASLSVLRQIRLYLFPPYCSYLHSYRTPHQLLTRYHR